MSGHLVLPFAGRWFVGNGQYDTRCTNEYGFSFYSIGSGVSFILPDSYYHQQGLPLYTYRRPQHTIGGLAITRDATITNFSMAFRPQNYDRGVSITWHLVKFDRNSTDDYGTAVYISDVYDDANDGTDKINHFCVDIPAEFADVKKGEMLTIMIQNATGSSNSGHFYVMEGAVELRFDT